MSEKAKKKLSPTQQEYQDFAQAREPKRSVLFNCVKAFFVGGGICLLGQFIQDFFIWNFDFTEKTAGSPTVAILILISVILTSAGLYDHFGQWAGAGTAVPVTGFANSIASAAIEHRTEGYVLGVGSNMFKFAGSVIVFGVFAAFVVALIKTIFSMLGGG